MFADASSSCTSRRRTFESFIAYSLAPSRNTARSIATSSKSSFGKMRRVLSNTMVTAARLARGAMLEPDQMRSSLRFPRMDFIDCSPSAKRKASATFDFPEPFGPTTDVTDDEKSSTVFRANDLNPAISNRFSIRKSIPYACRHDGIYKKNRSLGRKRFFSAGRYYGQCGRSGSVRAKYAMMQSRPVSSTLMAAQKAGLPLE